MADSTEGHGGAAATSDADIDWDALRAVALDAMTKAYVPYSKFPVGVAAIVDDGRVIAGCNVENASYGLTLCAECALVSTLHMTGGGRLVAFTCVDGDGGAVRTDVQWPPPSTMIVLTACVFRRQLQFQQHVCLVIVPETGDLGWEDGRS